MKNRNSALGFTLLACALLGTGCSAPEMTKYLGGTTHLPLADSRVMKYQSHVGDHLTEYTVTFHYIGGHFNKIFHAAFKGIDAGGCEFQAQDFVVYFATDHPATNLFNSDEYYDVRTIWVKEGVEMGDSWLNEEAGTSTLYAGTETVSVPAGSFSDCYKTVTEGTQELLDSLEARHKSKTISDELYRKQLAAANTVVVRWFAPNVGLIKEQFGSSDNVRELIAVEHSGSGKVDSLPPDLPVEITPEEPHSPQDQQENQE